MFLTRSTRGFRIAGLSMMAGSILLPAAAGFAAEAPTALRTALFADRSSDMPARIVQAVPARSMDDRSASAAIAPELECMAKVVHHEAGGEPRKGQLAVAQLMMNRKQSGRFADSICGVAAQRGQFFDTVRYNPPRNTSRWQSAIDVSREAMAGTTEPVVPGAVFFRAAYAAPTAFFRTRQQVAQLGGHVFYR